MVLAMPFHLTRPLPKMNQRSLLSAMFEILERPDMVVVQSSQEDAANEVAVAMLEVGELNCSVLAELDNKDMEDLTAVADDLMPAIEVGDLVGKIMTSLRETEMLASILRQTGSSLRKSTLIVLLS
jgi:hypothetical protein